MSRKTYFKNILKASLFFFFVVFVIFVFQKKSDVLPEQSQRLPNNPPTTSKPIGEQMQYNKAYKLLESIGQQNVLKNWSSLPVEQQSHLLDEISSLDLSSVQFQQNLLKNPLSSLPTIENVEPFSEFTFSGNAQDKANGRMRISEGKVGCLLIAGGQGTRLRFAGPKGMFPVTPIKNKTLFQIFAEKTIAAGKQAGRALPIAIMTSPLNHEDTLNFFKENNYFGLDLKQLSFFSQGTLPFLDQEGNLILDNDLNIAQGPDGNGSSLHDFYSSGIWKKWKVQGVEQVNYVLIDNALADPYDAELIGFHHRNSSEITVKCTMRKNENEKVGVLSKQNGKVRVIEYSELNENDRVAYNADGTLKYSCANISLFCFTMDFIQKCHQRQMPLHSAFKAMSTKEGSPKVWKFEKFIFDVFQFADTVSALLYTREESFSPLKNAEGADTLADVQKALINHDKKTFTDISGSEVPNRAIELAQQFHYPTPELVERWKGKAFPNDDYIAE